MHCRAIITLLKTIKIFLVYIAYMLYYYINWKIKLYKKLNGEIPVLEYILDLPPKQRTKIESEIDILEKHGINLILKKRT